MLLIDTAFWCPLTNAFNKESLEYLGFILGKNGIAMHPSKLATIADWPEPHSIKNIQWFLGLANFYRWFILHYASIAGPLYELMCKDAPIPFKLTDEACWAVVMLKNAFQTAPILKHHDPSKPVYLFTNVSDFTISGIPHQADRWRWKLAPTMFLLSKTLGGQNQLWHTW